MRAGSGRKDTERRTERAGAPAELQVLYEDNHLLVVVKPAGMLSQEDATGDRDVITEARAYIKRRYGKPGNVFAGLVHRIDRPVSGVMVVARTSKAAARLSREFAERGVRKEYLAIVEGRWTGERTLHDHLLKKDRHVRVVRPGAAGAREARLHATGIGVFGQTSLVRADLETGRPHQIRVQLAHAGHPIAGDLRYGARRPFDGRNIALCCVRLTLTHPTRRQRMSFAAPPPPTWPSDVRHLATEALDLRGNPVGEE